MAFLIEKIELGNFPTPAHRLDRISDLLKSEIWIKRDDLSGKIYGGNKVRKLEYLLADAKRKKSETVITFGGLGSHHCVAVAAYASLLGMKVVVILFNQPLTPYVRESLLLDYTFGAEMKYAGSYLKAFYLGIREYVKRRKSYLILPGGSNPLSTLGYMDAVKELKQQIDRGEIPPPQYIFVPVGSGGTIAGLVAGASEINLPVFIIGVRVVPFINEFFILRLAKKAMELSGCRKSVQRKFRILGEYYGGRYGLPTKGCMKAIEMMEEMEGIRLEPTYTGKAFHALLDFAEGRKGKRILFWNTYSFVRASADYRELPEEFRRFWRWQYIQS